MIIQVGQAIGALWTILLLIVDSIIGARLLRVAGPARVAAFQEALAAGRMPHREILDGVLIIVGGAFLLTPGFITDVVRPAAADPARRARSIARGVTRMLAAPRPAAVAHRVVPPGGSRRQAAGPRPRARTPSRRSRSSARAELERPSAGGRSRGSRRRHGRPLRPDGPLRGCPGRRAAGRGDHGRGRAVAAGDARSRARSTRAVAIEDWERTARRQPVTSASMRALRRSTPSRRRAAPRRPRRAAPRERRPACAGTESAVRSCASEGTLDGRRHARPLRVHRRCARTRGETADGRRGGASCTRPRGGRRARARSRRCAPAADAARRRAAWPAHLVDARIGRPAPFEDVRLSTDLRRGRAAAQGRRSSCPPRRRIPARLSGEAVCGALLELGGAARVSFFRWSLDGAAGLGRYEMEPAP